MGADASADNSNFLTKSNEHEMIAIVTIMVTLLLHSVSIKLEQILKRHKHLSEMLHHLYRELMVLGLISFGLFAVESQRETSVDHETKSTFENIHVMIFLIAFGYTVFTALLMSFSVRISKFWDGIELQDHSNYIQIKNSFEQIRELYLTMNFFSRALHIPTRLRYFNLVEQISFHDLRLHFLHSNHLPPSFSFARYLRKCKRHVLLQFGDIHSACWMSLLILLMIDMIQRNSFSILTSANILFYWRVSLVSLGALLCIIPISIFLKTRSILSEILCHSEMIDFDPVAAMYYIDHWGESEDNAPETSLSYAYGDDHNQATNVHFTAESALHQVARTYQIDHWGKTGAPDVWVIPPVQNATSVLPEGSVLSQNEPPRLGRVQSVHNVEFSQMKLFWFNSHVFMLRLMQVCVFIAVWYCAIVFQFHSELVGNQYWMYPISAIPLLILLTCFSWTIPIYTIIIHVGQLVDLDIVIEARMKASKPSPDLSAVTIAPAQLRRASTLMLIPKSDRMRIQVSVVVFGGRFQMALFWGIFIQTTLVLAFYFPDLWLHPIIPYVTPIIPFLFMVEMGLKLYAAGPKFFIRSTLVFFDLIIVLCAFTVSIAQLFTHWISPVASAIVLWRLFQIIRAARIGRIMRHQRESVFEARIGEGEIELQMQRTRDKIIEAVEAEPNPLRVITGKTSDSEFALRRSHTLPVSPHPARKASCRLSLEDGDHVDVPVEKHPIR